MTNHIAKTVPKTPPIKVPIGIWWFDCSSHLLPNQTKNPILPAMVNTMLENLRIPFRLSESRFGGVGIDLRGQTAAGCWARTFSFERIESPCVLSKLRSCRMSLTLEARCRFPVAWAPFSTDSCPYWISPCTRAVDFNTNNSCTTIWPSMAPSISQWAQEMFPLTRPDAPMTKRPLVTNSPSKNDMRALIFWTGMELYWHWLWLKNKDWYQVHGPQNVGLASL